MRYVLKIKVFLYLFAMYCNAVSYTHLDVYKRQALSCLMDSLEKHMASKMQIDLNHTFYLADVIIRIFGTNTTAQNLMNKLNFLAT